MRSSAISLLAIVMVGCATGPAVSWGPLAVARMDFGMQARNVGTLVITERCVFLERDGERALLVWPADQTSWRPSSSEIAFRGLDGVVWTMRDAQPVVLGGGTDSRETDGPEHKEPMPLDWVAAPDPSCISPTRFLVSGVSAD